MKFGSTWFKAALLGSAMFAAVGFASAENVKVQFTAPASTDGTLKITYTESGTTKNVDAAGTDVPKDTQLAIEVTVVDATKTPKLTATVESTPSEVTLTKETDKYTATYKAEKAVTFAVEFLAPTGHKLTEDFETGITATYNPTIANKEQVAAGKYTVTFAVSTGRELNEVKLDDTKLEPKEASNPFVFEFTMPNKPATLKATLQPQTPTGHKLTEDFETDITATYNPTIANKDQVAGGKYTVTFVVPTGRELNEVKLDDTKLNPKEATNPLVYEFTMPGDKGATLKATLKPQATKQIKVTWTIEPKEGVKETLFSEAIIEGGELAGWEDDNVEMAQAGVYYIASFAVDIARFDFISLSLKEKNSAGETTLRVVPANRIGVYAPKKKYNCHFTVVTWKSSDDVVECELIVKTKFKDYEITLVDNGATVKIKAEGAEIDPKTTKVTAMSALEFTIEPPQNTSIRKVIFAGAVLKPEADGKTYKATMPEEPAKLIVKIDDGTSVEDNAFADASVYPNPFAEKITVTEVAEANRILLVNAQGVVLRSVAVNGANQIDLDVADVPAGIYMVVVENGAARRAFKVVK